MRVTDYATDLRLRRVLRVGWQNTTALNRGGGSDYGVANCYPIRAGRPKIKTAAEPSLCRCFVGQHKYVAENQHFGFVPVRYGGDEGSRTPVRKPIPCSSTIIVDCLTFPPVHENQHPCTFSSFMIRPASQSFDTVVSYMFEAWVLKCRCFKSDCCN